MRKRVVVVGVAAAVVLAAGAVGVVLAQPDERGEESPSDSVTRTSNDEPGPASDYWTDERKRGATGG